MGESVRRCKGAAPPFNNKPNHKPRTPVQPVLPPQALRGRAVLRQPQHGPPQLLQPEGVLLLSYRGGLYGREVNTGLVWGSDWDHARCHFTVPTTPQQQRAHIQHTRTFPSATKRHPRLGPSTSKVSGSPRPLRSAMAALWRSIT